MSDNYDVQQVCENGHKVTGCYNISEGERRKHCQKCGAPTIIACTNCDANIPGDRLGGGDWMEDIYTVESVNVPSYCHNCGEPYPWTNSKIETAIQILTEFGDLNAQEKKTIEQDINNIAKDVPQAELSAKRIKRIWEKCQRAGYEIIMEFASRTAAKILKEP